MTVVKQFFDVVLVMPVGPACKPEFIADSLYSFMHYSTCDYKIILADDSQKGTGLKIKKLFPRIDVVTTERSMGKLCGLYITLCKAFRHALDNYRFRAVLRMDTDALIIGTAPEQEALQLFKTNPQIGIAGQYPLDYDGQPWDISWPRYQVKRLTGSRTFLKKPYAHLLLLLQYKRAIKRGYKTGESVFGGACFISEKCLTSLHQSGLLPMNGLKTVELEEDHLFSMLAISIGFKLGNLSSGKLPLGCAWKGLPAPPEELYASGKKIIHSTRNWQHMNEEDIRKWFRNKRTHQQQLAHG